MQKSCVKASWTDEYPHLPGAASANLLTSRAGSMSRLTFLNVKEAEMLQLLSPEGLLIDGALDEAATDSARLVTLYRAMRLARDLDSEALMLQRQGQLGLHCSSRGQEAAQVGVVSALGELDWCFPQAREFAAFITLGLDPSDWLHVFRGTWFCHHDVLATRFGPQTMPIATQLPHAVGRALAMKLLGQAGVVIAFVGDGGTSAGDTHEAMNMAQIWRVPCVFVVQNNGWSISVPNAAEIAGSLVDRAAAYGMPAERCDGNDVLAVRAAALRAVEHARSGQGPAFIEAVTYRMEGHTTSDDPKRYRPTGELETWAERDPILRLERLLEAQDLLTPALTDEIAAEIAAARARLRTAIWDAPSAPLTRVFEDVFACIPPALAEQREDALTAAGVSQ